MAEDFRVDPDKYEGQLDNICSLLMDSETLVRQGEVTVALKRIAEVIEAIKSVMDKASHASPFADLGQSFPDLDKEFLLFLDEEGEDGLSNLLSQLGGEGIVLIDE